jgi:hypothetical protein
MHRLLGAWRRRIQFSQELSQEWEPTMDGSKEVFMNIFEDDTYCAISGTTCYKLTRTQVVIPPGATRIYHRITATSKPRGYC